MYSFFILLLLPFLSAFAQSQTASLGNFLPLESNPEPETKRLLEEHLNQELINNGFTRSDGISNWKIQGYYSRSKSGNLNLYYQVLDSNTDTVIDALNVTDDLLDSLELPLDRQEIKVTDESRAKSMSQKIIKKIKSNPNKKPQFESIDEYIISSQIGTKLGLKLPEVTKEAQTEEVFKIFQESEINRKVEVASLFSEDELVVGSTVAVIDEKQWKKYGVRRTNEAVNFFPGTHATGYTGGAQPIVVRGYTNAQSLSGIAMLIDGVPVNTFTNSSGIISVPNFGLGALNRIEMIRGPGSAIYGSDAFHGVYSLKTFESEKDTVSVSGETGDFGFSNGSFKASKALNEKLRIHIAGSSLRQRPNLQDGKINTLSIDPFFSSLPIELRSPFPAPLNQYRPIHDLPVKRQNQYTSDTAVIKLDYKATDRLTFKFGTYGSAYMGKGFGGIATRAAYDRDVSNLESKFFMGNFTTNYKMDNHLEADIQIYGWNSRIENSFPLYVRAPIADYLTFFSGSNENRYGASFTLKQEKNSFNTQWILSASSTVMHIQDTRLETSASKREDLAIGAAFGIANNFKFRKHPFNGLDRRIQSAFFQTKTGIWEDKLYLLLGGRYDKYSDFGNQTTPRVGLIFLPIPTTSIKLLYGKAFRAPAAPDLTFNTTVKGDPTIQPEIIDSYEFILMNKTKNWKAEFIAFQNFWKNAIIASQNPNLSAPFQAEYKNFGNNTSKGVELDFQYFRNEYQFMAAASTVLSKDMTKPNPYLIRGTEPIINPALILFPNNSGNRFTLYPLYTISHGIGYNWIKRNLNFYLIHRWFTNTKDKQHANITNATEIKTYSRFDLTISSKVNDNLNFYAIMRNIFNRNNYYPSAWGNDYGYQDERVNASIQLEYIF